MSCNALSIVNCYAINPPTITDRTFEDVETSSVELHVAKDAEAAYKETEYWKDFSIIADLDSVSGIEGIEANGSDATAEYFNLNGVRVNGEALAPGLYLKRQGANTTTVLVK